MPKQGERTEASRRAIIDAALQIIASQGYRAMTTTRIEELTGVSRGLVGYHFGSKQGLTAAVIRHVQDAFVERIVGPREADWTTGLDGVVGVVRGYLGQLSRDSRPSCVMLMLTVESIAGQPPLRESIRTLNAVLRDSLRDQLARGQADGSVRDDLNPTEEALLLAGMLRGLTVQWLADPEGVDLGRATDTAVAVVRRGYACA